MQANIPYFDIVKQFEHACNIHLGIASFATGTIDYLDASAVNKQWPLVYLRPTASVGYSQRERFLNFDLFSLDIPKLSDESPVMTQSRTEMFLYDLLAYFNFGDFQQIYTVDMLGISPVNEAFQDRAYGWVANIQVSTPFVLDYCDYPKL